MGEKNDIEEAKSVSAKGVQCSRNKAETKQAHSFFEDEMKRLEKNRAMQQSSASEEERMKVEKNEAMQALSAALVFNERRRNSHIRQSAPTPQKQLSTLERIANSLNIVSCCTLQKICNTETKSRQS